MNINGKNFNIGSRTFIVGILNVTPDSFSDGGQFYAVDNAVQRAIKMESDGADIIEIGGESSRPGFTPVDEKTELERITPVLHALSQVLTVPIAVDTYKANVANYALQNGASIINDIFCFKRDPDMPKVCAAHNAICIIMHNRNNHNYDHFIPDVIADLDEGIKLLTAAGVPAENIIIDPGVGFAKGLKHNIEVLQNLDQFAALPYPVMLGASRKSFIGKTLGLSVDERLEATIATTVLGITQGCDFIRVHDVLENKRAAAMTDEIVRKK